MKVCHTLKRCDSLKILFIFNKIHSIILDMNMSTDDSNQRHKSPQANEASNEMALVNSFNFQPEHELVTIHSIQHDLVRANNIQIENDSKRANRLLAIENDELKSTNQSRETIIQSQTAIIQYQTTVIQSQSAIIKSQATANQLLKNLISDTAKPQREKYSRRKSF